MRNMRSKVIPGVSGGGVYRPESGPFSDGYVQEVRAAHRRRPRRLIADAALLADRPPEPVTGDPIWGRLKPPGAPRV